MATGAHNGHGGRGPSAKGYWGVRFLRSRGARGGFFPCSDGCSFLRSVSSRGILQWCKWRMASRGFTRLAGGAHIPRSHPGFWPVFNLVRGEKGCRIRTGQILQGRPASKTLLARDTPSRASTVTWVVPLGESDLCLGEMRDHKTNSPLAFPECQPSIRVLACPSADPYRSVWPPTGMLRDSPIHLHHRPHFPFTAIYRPRACHRRLTLLLCRSNPHPPSPAGSVKSLPPSRPRPNWRTIRTGRPSASKVATPMHALEPDAR